MHHHALHRVTLAIALATIAAILGTSPLPFALT